MAGDWIKMEAATPDKPEVWEIASNLDCDPDAALGKLFRVWCWFDAHTEEGNASTVTKKLLDRLVGVTGFCDEMIRAGWMVEAGGTISLPNFDRHNGKTAKNRALTAKRVSEHKKKGNDKGNAEVTDDALPREEKRREEKDSPRASKSTPPTKPEGVSDEVWKDALDHRKRMKAPLTETAWKRMEPDLRALEAEGWSPDDVIAEWLAAGWRAFKADWIRNRGGGSKTEETNNPFAGAL